MDKTFTTGKMILCGLFAAITAVCSMVSIPLPFSPVPVNLATLSVFLSGGLLGSKAGAVSQLVYVILGAAGLPVFHNFTGGLSILAGPTGGFLIGYIAAAFIVGIFAERSAPPQELKIFISFKVIGFMAGLASCYALGTIWFMYIMKANIWTALISCVFPFLIGDALKIVFASIIIKKLKPLINNN